MILVIPAQAQRLFPMHPKRFLLPQVAIPVGSVVALRGPAINVNRRQRTGSVVEQSEDGTVVELWDVHGQRATSRARA